MIKTSGVENDFADMPHLEDASDHDGNPLVKLIKFVVITFSI